MDNIHLPIAHVREDGKTHLLEDHLREVAKRAGRFAAAFESAEWAHLAGLWHDLGKYRPGFQKYIRAASGLDAHVEGAPGRIDHSTLGAVHAVDMLGKGYGTLLAYLIAGHHAGLPDYTPEETGNKALIPRLDRGKTEGLLDELIAAQPPDEILTSDPPSGRPPGTSKTEQLAGMHLWLRMLFSCLVDADFLDTERFMDTRRSTNRVGYPDVQQLLQPFTSHMERLIAQAPPTIVNKLRADIYSQCCKQAQKPPGIFSLTVPTGGGKTLASLGFALHHAIRYGKRRVVYVIPYTSIIEQNADVFRQVFADNLGDVLVEHHSNAETPSGNENHRSRLACENWDAPLIITTSVQFFESLYAARTSRVRKLHNLVNSVVILDEAQLVPPEFRKSILATLKQLTDHYGVTLVLSTATQPALGSVSQVEQSYHGLDQVTEIIGDPADLHQKLRRVDVSLPEDLDTPVEWESLSSELQHHPSVLCIVNRRDDCRTLHQLMPAGTVHLSALMCGQHRADTIADIKQQLGDDETTRVVSTQLVEAGVDLDFPVVYRALAGLDSIAQAAGRCNREGRLSEPGQVKVFVPPSRNLGQIYKAEKATRELLYDYTGDLLEPQLFTRFFRLFYQRIDPDRADIEELLIAKEGYSIQFRTAATQFRLIDDSYHLPVFVEYNDEGARCIDQLRRLGPERWLMRGLQRYSVNLNRNDHQRLLHDGMIEEVWPGIFVQQQPELYDRTIGVVVNAEPSSESMVV